jgi:hypothetical protein
LFIVLLAFSETERTSSFAIQVPEHSLCLNQYLFSGAVVNYAELLPDFPQRVASLSCGFVDLQRMPGGKAALFNVVNSTLQCGKANSR